VGLDWAVCVATHTCDCIVPHKLPRRGNVMAKHNIDALGKVSKGLRRSSLGLKREPVKGMPEKAPFTTATAEAFRVSLTRDKVNQRVGRIVVNVMADHPKSGVINMGKGWNAHLSKRTYDSIKAVCGL
jgi:hypothetical protein